MGKSVEIRPTRVIRIRFGMAIFIGGGAGSMTVGALLWKSAEGRGLGIEERGAQETWRLGGMLLILGRVVLFFFIIAL